VAVLPVVAGLAAALATGSVTTLPYRVEAGTPAWRRLVGGARGDGRLLPRRASVALPGLPRRPAPSLLVEADAVDGGPLVLGVAVDGGPLRPFHVVPGQAVLVALPEAGAPGARLGLMPADGARARVRAIHVASAPARRVGTSFLAAAIAALATLALRKHLGRAALALGLVLAALLALVAAPPLLWLSLPSGPALLRLLPAAAAALVALVVGLRSDAAARRALGRATVLATAFVFGAWVRGIFMPSAGSWDTEYWKTWMLRAASHGIARVYGDPEPFDAGRLLRQARGHEPMWKISREGRDYGIDYPPLGLAAWSASWWLVNRVAPGLEPREAENMAVKLPPVLGDLGAVLLLLWALRDTPDRGLGLAALYWALPVSWLSSAVLGFLDAALAPLVAAALVAAGRGRAAASGVWLTLACLIKPTSAIAAPAAILALHARRASVLRAAAAGLAVTVASFAPYAVVGSLATALVQNFRLFFQERLSGGFPNPWWLLSHGLTIARTGTAAFWEPVDFVRVEAVPVPARLVGLVLFVGLAALICWRQRGHAGPGPALLAGAALFFSYGLVGVGVHENHPHALYLLLFATGLISTRLRVLTAVTSAVYVLNMLAMSGLGRFYGTRYVGLEPLIQAAAAFRMAAGIDVTLVLTLVNLAAFAWMLTWLGKEMRSLAVPSPYVGTGGADERVGGR
jgi:hypothetical protein